MVIGNIFIRLELFILGVGMGFLKEVEVDKIVVEMGFLKEVEGDNVVVFIDNCKFRVVLLVILMVVVNMEVIFFNL